MFALRTRDKKRTRSDGLYEVRGLNAGQEGGEPSVMSESIQRPHGSRGEYSWHHMQDTVSGPLVDHRDGYPVHRVDLENKYSLHKIKY